MRSNSLRPFPSGSVMMGCCDRTWRCENWCDLWSSCVYRVLVCLIAFADLLIPVQLLLIFSNCCCPSRIYWQHGEPIKDTCNQLNIKMYKRSGDKIMEKMPPTSSALKTNNYLCIQHILLTLVALGRVREQEINSGQNNITNGRPQNIMNNCQTFWQITSLTLLLTLASDE